MRSFVLKHGILIAIGIVLLGSVGVFTINTLTRDPLEGLILTTVDEGIVEQIVSVSGVTRSRNTAELAFPTSGIVASVPVSEGMMVASGTLLATLGSAREVAGLERARADVAIAEAALANLLSGTRDEAREVTSASVAQARAEVARVTATENLAVENAKRALYSNQLTARSINPNEDATPPAITGTYRCNESGTYNIRIYGASAQSGFAMAVTGLESGTYTAGVNQPDSFGTCGLFLQLSQNQNYNNTNWVVDVPNQTAPNYITLKNSLTAAENSRESAIASANDALTIAERKQILENAAPVPADIRAAEARVAQARAALAEITATLADRSIIAPFDGTVTNVDILPGETAQTAPVITLLATDAFEVVARVPEIDITKIDLEQPVRILFDAAKDEPQQGRISFIAPLPTEIDGVAYFEVKIKLDTPPTWLRGGLNADVDIIIGRSEQSVRVPTRYLIDNTVRTLSGTRIASTSVTVLFTGNDGYVAIDGIAPGTTIVAP